MFRSNSNDKLKNFPKKCFPSKCSSKHGESSFDNFTEKFVPLVLKKFAQNPNLRQRQNNWKNLHLENVLWTRTKQFGPPLRKVFAESQEMNCSWSSKNGEVFFQKGFLIRVFPWSRRKHFWKMCNDKIVISQNNASTKIQKIEEVFKEELFSIKEFVWTRRKQFWQICD